jgi:hypothetical protein
MSKRRILKKKKSTIPSSSSRKQYKIYNIQMGILRVVYSIEIIDIRSIRKQRASPSPVDAALGQPLLENIPIYAVFAGISFSWERKGFLIDRESTGGE